MKNYKVDPKIENQVRELLRRGESRTYVAAELQRAYGYGKSKSYGILRQVERGWTCSNKDVEVEVFTTIEDGVFETNNGKYTYNKPEDTYVFPSKHSNSGNIVLSGDSVRAIKRSYSGVVTKPRTIEETARKFNLTRPMLLDVLKRLQTTHDSLPFTDEEIAEKSQDELITSALQEKQTELAQNLEVAKWKAIEEGYLKYCAIQTGVVDPFTNFLSTWNPKPYEPIYRTPDYRKKSDKVFVATAYDWHIGGRSEGRYTQNGRDWNLVEQTKAVHAYINQIRNHLDNLVSKYAKCVIVFGGDLFNSLTGFTANGTPLNNEFIKDTQFEAVFNLASDFIRAMLEEFDEVEVHFVRGNHGGLCDYPLGLALKSLFSLNKRITTFEVTSKRHSVFRVKDVLVIAEHGASDQTKHLVPKDGVGRETYVQQILLNNQDMLDGVKQKIFMMGDLHHYVQKDHGSFEFFQVGALPVSDQYSDAKGLQSRPRQNCLIIGDTGVEQVLHCYVD